MAVLPTIGAFEVRVEAFEDRGVRWQLSLDDINRFQFARSSVRASPADTDELNAARARFDRVLEIPIDPVRRTETLERITNQRAALESELKDRLPQLDLAAHIDRRQGDERLAALLEALLDELGLAEVDSRFTRSFVSNPRSGECMKGHAIVLAELGLCPYRGQVVRDPETFAEPLSRQARAAHLITRLAFSQALWARLGYTELTLYRGAASEQPLGPRAEPSFVSATFSEDVARAHFEGGPTTRSAALWRRRVELSRVLMTFLETRALNDRFKEAEALLIADPERGF